MIAVLINIQIENIVLLQEVLRELFRMAKIYKRQHDNCSILIIDNASHLTLHNLDLLNH